MKYLFAFLIIVLATNSYAGTDAEKLAAAERYMATAPLSDMINDMTAKVAVQIPENRRANFIRVMTEEIDMDRLESAVLDAMVKTFTLEELNALADFYGSEVGKSAMAKFGTYMALVMPTIQQEMIRAVKKVESGQ